MKYIKILAALLLTASFTGCMEDKGNYDYILAEEVLPVTVTGLPETVTFELGKEASITAVVEGLPKAESEYEFVWYSFPYKAQGYIPERDTLGFGKTLTFTCNYQPGVDRNLSFVIRDKQTNIRSITETTMIIQAVSIGAGYYIVKDIDDKTDLDYIATDGTQHSDLLQLFLGKRLEGKAVKSLYQTGYYRHTIYHEDGSTTALANQKALHILSESDGVTLNGSTFELFKNFDEMFYGPVEHKPTDIAFGSFGYYGLFLMNAGNMHTLYGMSVNVGIYSDSKSRTDDTEPRLYPNFIFSDYPEAALCFDMETRSFCYVTSFSTRTTNAASQPSGKEDLPSAVNMDMDMVALLSRTNNYINSAGVPAWAILRSTSQPYKYYLGDIYYLENTYPFRDFDELGADRKLPHGEVFAANRSASAIYFANGNKISYYTKNEEDDNSEEVEITFQQGQMTAGEQVVFMDHLYAYPSLTTEFAVLTNSAEGWKLYIFPLISGTARLDTENAKIFSGTGNARHVMLRR